MSKQYKITHYSLDEVKKAIIEAVKDSLINADAVWTDELTDDLDEWVTYHVGIRSQLVSWVEDFADYTNELKFKKETERYE